MQYRDGRASIAEGHVSVTLKIIANFPEFVQFCIASFRKDLSSLNPLRLPMRPHHLLLLRLTMDHPSHFKSASSAYISL
jgi:hypothetical protein